MLVKDDVVRMLCELLAEIQKNSGREQSRITGATFPIGDLPGFDSLNGVEATVLVEARLGIELDCIDIFVNQEGTKALAIAEVAANICASVGS